MEKQIDLGHILIVVLGAANLVALMALGLVLLRLG